jgi:hypothetical protein
MMEVLKEKHANLIDLIFENLNIEIFISILYQ